VRAVSAWLWRWLGLERVHDLEADVGRLEGRIDRTAGEQRRTEALCQALADDRKSLAGRLAAAENSAAAANSRAERLETALGRLSGRVEELEAADHALRNVESQAMKVPLCAS